MRPSVRAAGLLLAALGSGLHAQGTTPTGWVRFRPESSYFVSLDTTVAKGGRASLTVRAIPDAASADGYNGARQFVDAAPYRGKRVRVRAQLRGNNAGQADLYIRVEGFAGDTAVRWFYDDMANRPLHGHVRSAGGAVGARCSTRSVARDIRCFTRWWRADVGRRIRYRHRRCVFRVDNDGDAVLLS